MELSDHSILSHLGGLEKNSLISIFYINNNQLQVIKHSSYYDLDKFKKLVNETFKIVCILSLNIEYIYIYVLNLMNWKHSLKNYTI